MLKSGVFKLFDKQKINKGKKKMNVNGYIKTYEILEKILKDNNIHYFAEGGTVIGCLRHRDIIPWDKDIDIGIDVKQIPKLLKLKPLFKKHNMLLMGSYNNYKGKDNKFPIDNLHNKKCKHYLNIIHDKGFCSNLELGKKDNGFFLKVYSYTHKITIDIFPHAKQYDSDKYCPTAYVSTGYNKDFYFNDIYNIVPCKLNKFIIPICNDSINYLKLLYGEDVLIKNMDGQLV